MPVNLAYRAYQFVWQALDWVYPPSCGGCGSVGYRFCPACLEKTAEISLPVCPICGDPNLDEKPCIRCQSSKPYFTALRSCTIFDGPAREALHRFKYQNDIGLGEVFARLMVVNLKNLGWSFDLITSVPLSLARLKERGYNQATLLARPISLALKSTFTSRILSRIRETRTQVGLSVYERQENMAGAFKANKRLVFDRIILVVDDVATSGATINACAKALLDEGASKVYGFTFARAILSPDGVTDIT